MNYVFKNLVVAIVSVVVAHKTEQSVKVDCEMTLQSQFSDQKVSQCYGTGAHLMPRTDLHGFEEGSNMEKARHEVSHALPPTEAVMNNAVRSKEPTVEDVFKRGDDGTLWRRIYGGQQLTQSELALLDSFRAWLAQSRLSVPKGYLDEHNYALRFLTTEVDNIYQNTYNHIMATESWLTDSLIPNMHQLNEHLPMLQLGGLYAHGRDKSKRPIVIQRGRELLDAQINQESFISLNDFVLVNLIENAMVPGRVEQFVYIIDAGDLSPFEIPYRQLMKLITHQTNYFRQRSAMVYLINLPWVIHQAAKVAACTFFKFQQQQLKMFGTDFHDEFMQEIGVENLEQRYGGNLPNLQKGQFWPPILNM